MRNFVTCSIKGYRHESIASQRGKTHSNLLALVTAFLIGSQVSYSNADEFVDALVAGKAYGDARLRYESVSDDADARKDADALTVRTRLGYKTGEFSGFHGVLEFEDSRVVADMDDFNSTQNGKTEYSVIADPPTTELDQAYINYSGKSFSSKLGRQVITLDNHRFVGHVGWRQDRQTFDGLRFDLKPRDNLTLMYTYVGQRNRIFADASNVNSKDHLLNASLKTAGGTLVAYGYLLEVDNTTSNSLETYGIRFSGSIDMGDSKLVHTTEFAKQENKNGSAKSDANYMFLEAGAVVSAITAKIGYEVLGSDNGNYGFSTPLATLHKFNGWADQFLGTGTLGLTDLALTLSTNVAGGKLMAVYHDFSADESTDSIDDLGSEIDLLYSKKFGKHYNAGIKYAAYSAGDAASGKVDTDKLWMWVGMTF